MLRTMVKPKQMILWYLERHYRGRPYREFYRAWISIQSRLDPKEAVGGKWDEIGQLQFDYLRCHGLQPHHRLLDIGCGSLRGGLHFIRYLDSGHYVGLDISPKILAAGRRFLRDAGLEQKQPVLLVNTDLAFDLLAGQRFDFVIAQSVLTHMPLADVEELFTNMSKVLCAGGQFFATFFDGSEIRQTSLLGFRYPFEVMRELGERHGLDIMRMEDFSHPRGQVMMKITARDKVAI